jgi:hypothetical protein
VWPPLPIHVFEYNALTRLGFALPPPLDQEWLQTQMAR